MEHSDSSDQRVMSQAVVGLVEHFNLTDLAVGSLVDYYYPTSPEVLSQEVMSSAKHFNQSNPEVGSLVDY